MKRTRTYLHVGAVPTLALATWVAAASSAQPIPPAPSGNTGSLTSTSYWTPLYQNDFESVSDQGWYHREDSLGLTDDWHHGWATGKSGNTLMGPWVDPKTDLAGAENRIWGTDLGFVGWNGEYNYSTNSYLQSPLIQVPHSRQLKLHFSRWLTKSGGKEANIIAEDGHGNLLTTIYDAGLNEISESSWNRVQHAFTIPAGASYFRIRFRLQGGGVGAGGWNIDDLSVMASVSGPVGGNTLELRGNTALTVGEVPTFEVSQAPPHSPVLLYGSKNLGPTVVRGQVLDLGADVILLGTATADAQGVARFVMAAPTTAMMHVPAYLEAVVTGLTPQESNPLPLRVWD